MSRFMSRRFDSLEAYTPGEQPGEKEFIKLNTNESPYPPSEQVFMALSREEIGKLNRYPDPTGSRLKKKLAALYGVEPNQILLSNGSDEVLDFAFMAFCDAENGVMFPEISYGFYPVYANLYGIPYTAVPLKQDYSIDYHDYEHAKGMVVIANPNAPTGMAIPVREIEEIVKSNPDHVVLIDEAYVDFGGESSVELTKKYENVLVSQTFSKSRSMAGARLGFAIGSPALIEDLEKIRCSTNPYNVNRMTLAAGEAAVDSQPYYMEKVRNIVETRSSTAKRLREMGFFVFPSKANFVFAKKDPIPGSRLYEELKKRGVLVRYFNQDKIRDFIRISIGTEEQMDSCLKALEEIIKEEQA